MIAIAIVVIISFAFFYNPGDPGRKSDDNVINVNDHEFSFVEVEFK